MGADHDQTGLLNGNSAYLIHMHTDDSVFELAGIHESLYLSDGSVPKLEDLLLMCAAQTFVAGSDQDHYAPLPHHLPGGVESLVGLPELNIEGVAIGNDDIVFPVELDPEHTLRLLATHTVGLHHVSGNSVDDYALAVEYHVDDEVQPCLLRQSVNGGSYRIVPVPENPLRGDVDSRPVHLVHSFRAAHPWDQDLSAPRKSADIYGHDSSQANHYIEPPHQLVDPNGNPLGRVPYVLQAVRILPLMIVDRIAAYGVLTQLFDQLLFGHGAVGPDGREKLDLTVLQTTIPELVQNRFNKTFYGRRSCVVVKHDESVCLPSGKLRKPLRSDGSVEGLDHDVHFGSSGTNFGQTEDLCLEPVGYV